MKYHEITTSELPKIRRVLLEKQDFRCAICDKDLSNEPTSNQHVDHQHLYKSDELGYRGNGLIRGVLCRDCNALEGKVWNNLHRFGKSNKSNPVDSRVLWLSNLLEYYKNAYYFEDPILHPKERRPEKLQKSEYNKILKWYKQQTFAYKRNGEMKPFPRFSGSWSSKLKKYEDLRLRENSSNKVTQISIHGDFFSLNLDSI